VVLDGRFYYAATLNEQATGNCRRATYWWEGNGNAAAGRHAAKPLATITGTDRALPQSATAGWGKIRRVEQPVTPLKPSGIAGKITPLCFTTALPMA
jgi:hypothetical protein